MTYIPGGKGIAPRQSTKPKWFGLKEIERTKDSVVFKTRTGRLYVSTSDVEKYEGVNLMARGGLRVSEDPAEKQFYTCLLCGRSKFTRIGQPHRCAGGFRKRFKKLAKQLGREIWIETKEKQ